MSRYDYYRPGTLDEALRLKAQTHDSRFVAGGTDLMVRIKDGAIRPAALISLRGIAGLSGISANGSLRIGGGTTIADIAASEPIRSGWPVLAEACAAIGSSQIRNVATIGGNLANASPCADSATPLLALDAVVELTGPRGRHTIPLERFFLGPGDTSREQDEVITAVLVDPMPATSRALFRKKGRVKMDLAVASVTVRVDLEGGKMRHVRIAAGSAAPTPLRLKPVEALLEGTAPSDALFAEAQSAAAAAVSPIDDLRSTAVHRGTLVGVFVRRALERLAGGNPS